MIPKPSMRPDLPTGTVTFLFTDVEGSTRLLEEIGDEAYEEALSAHRKIVRAEYLAHVTARSGDAFRLEYGHRRRTGLRAACRAEYHPITA